MKAKPERPKGSWKCVGEPEHQTLLDILLSGQLESAKIEAFKEDKRSRVYLIHWGANDSGAKAVLKFPDAGDRKPGSKLRTILGGPSTAQRQAKSLELLSSWGYKTPKVFAWAHKKRWGFVCESVLVMEYLKNAHAFEQPDSEQCQKIAGAVSDIHGRSYLHGDPYIHNFLFDTSGGLVLIDALLKPRQFWLTSKLQEWFHLDWGARKLAGNAISQKKEQLIEQSPIRFGIFRMLNWLKAMRSNAFRAKSGQ